jgi:hypothetical protein
MDYNIPVSLSFAETTTSSLALDAQTTFNFSSPYASGGSPDDLSAPEAPATATSSAAEGNAASSAAGTGVNTPVSSSGLNLDSLLLYGAIGFGAYLLIKHKGGI